MQNGTDLPGRLLPEMGKADGQHVALLHTKPPEAHPLSVLTQVLTFVACRATVRDARARSNPSTQPKRVDQSDQSQQFVFASPGVHTLTYPIGSGSLLYSTVL